jgi:ribosomal-protein-alanine N-acetyltransferase
MMIIREFIPSDLKRVFEIENMSFTQSYGINMFKSLYDMGTGFLVAEEEGYVIGYIIFWIKYENQGHIISLAVDKNYRRMKAGTRLLSKAIQILMMFNIANIYLEVNENNTGAYEFYKGFNFKVDRIVPDYYDTGDGAIVMYLPIIRSG